MSAILLNAVANQPASVRINKDWIKRRCKSDFDAAYWQEIVKKLDRVQHEVLCLQVASLTPRQNSMHELLAHGNTLIGKAPKGGGFIAYTNNINDNLTRHFVDALYMLDGPEPPWGLLVPFPTQWGGADSQFPYFAAKLCVTNLIDVKFAIPEQLR
jgi:hypothetical protein